MSARNSNWTIKYVIAIVAALLLGFALGSLPLFKATTLGTPKLTAAMVVQFVSYGGALTLFWHLGWQLSLQMRGAGQRMAGLAMLAVAFMTLVVVAVGYAVLTNFINPFVSKMVKQVVDWIFILGIVGAAVWLGWALFVGADALIAVVRDALARTKRS